MANAISAIASLGRAVAGHGSADVASPLGNSSGKAANQTTEMLAMPEMTGLDGTSSVSGATAGSGSFAGVLADAVQRVESFQADSNATITQFLSGADVDLHQVALTAQKAETTFELFSEVRNKVVQAYQEIMRAQV